MVLLILVWLLAEIVKKLIHLFELLGARHIGQHYPNPGTNSEPFGTEYILHQLRQGSAA